MAGDLLKRLQEQSVFQPPSEKETSARKSEAQKKWKELEDKAIAFFKKKGRVSISWGDLLGVIIWKDKRSGDWMIRGADWGSPSGTLGEDPIEAIKDRIKSAARDYDIGDAEGYFAVYDPKKSDDFKHDHEILRDMK